MSNIALKVSNISKAFRIPDMQTQTAKGFFMDLFRKRKYHTFHALDNVSLEIEKGDFFGIVGKNGSGKSTLLKILSGIYTPDTGTIATHGKIVSFLELGVGFNSEFSGRENIILSGTLLGIKKKDLQKKMQDIIAFSELEEFIDMRLKNYSSGMYVRLAFSVAIHADADILIMDEILAVGDMNFQKKCYKVFDELKAAGKTIILVSHDMANIVKFCNKSALLHEGKLIYQGIPEQTTQLYQQLNVDSQAEVNESSVNDMIASQKDKGAHIEKIELLNKDGKPQKKFQSHEDIIFRIHYKTQETLVEPNFAIALFKAENDLCCYDINTYLEKIEINPSDISKEGYFEIRFSKPPLLTGSYYAKIGLFGKYCDITYDFIDHSEEFFIQGKDNEFGAVYLEHTWNLQHL